MRPTALVASTLLLVPVASAFWSVASGFSPVASAPAPATGTPTRMPTPAQAQPQAASPIFRIETDEFWLNLHHFLYVLGRAESKAEDASREAVAGAPAEAKRGLNGLTTEEQRVWADAVSAYSTGPSQLDAIRGTPMPEITAALAQADDAAALADVSIDSRVRDTLERAAPVYRKVWWPAHRASNQAWRTSIEQLVAQHGRTILDFITRAYGLQWPAAGFAVHASRYSNWTGAYSSVRGVLVIASSYPGNDGLRGLEGIFHEGMHQWDGQVYSLLSAQAKAINATVPPDMPHALIWVTAGEAVRRLDQAYVPTVDALGIWKLTSSGVREPLLRLKAPIEDTWLPYLAGRGTRDEALAAVLAAAAQASRPSAIFRMETDEFWLNLHHFLYVLGRAEAKTRDASRDAVVDAPAEAERGLRNLSANERETWADTVTAYSTGLSRRDPIFDDTLAGMAGALAALNDAATLSGAAIDSGARNVLERAAPIYRRAWWPSHRASNQSWRASIQPLVDRHGQTVLAFVTRAYGMSWPVAGYPVHLVTYAHPLSAYSTPRSDLIMSTSSKSGMHGLHGLEMAFHEAMHQWDDDVLRLLRGHANKIGKEVPANLPHAMIWLTAGEAVRRAVPEHVPYAEAFALWKGAFAPLKPPLEVWKSYLEGRGTRDEAVATLVAKSATEDRR